MQFANDVVYKRARWILGYIVTNNGDKKDHIILMRNLTYREPKVILDVDLLGPDLVREVTRLSYYDIVTQLYNINHEQTLYALVNRVFKIVLSCEGNALNQNRAMYLIFREAAKYYGDKLLFFYSDRNWGTDWEDFFQISATLIDLKKCNIIVNF